MLENPSFSPPGPAKRSMTGIGVVARAGSASFMISLNYQVIALVSDTLRAMWKTSRSPRPEDPTSPAPRVYRFKI